MNSFRLHKSTYVAAFLLGALIALLFTAPARSAEPAEPTATGATWCEA